MKAYFQKYIFDFKKPAGTSRGVLLQKPSWFIFLYDEENPSFKGIGECSIIPGLSIDDETKIEQKISEVCALINAGEYNFDNTNLEFPAISFGVETAMLDYNSKGSKVLFPSDFTSGKSGIKTNGLIWMGNVEEMEAQIEQKLEAGFTCLKMKIGAYDIQDELQILRNLRRKYSSKDLMIRVDANGAFSYDEATEILKKLWDLEIHSIEQPIMASQLYEMAQLCENPPIPICLDEELLGKYPYENKRKLVELVRPQYLILKPGLLGGFKESADWINIADEFNIGWWATSALESNIGLNAIAQWVATLETSVHQGLGVGNLFKKNIESPLSMSGEKLFYNSNKEWNYEFVY